MPRKIDLIVIHCTASPNGRPVTVEDIDAWHRERGFMRLSRYLMDFNPHLSSIGYHYVIGVDGAVHTGRHTDEIGAHAQGHNGNSIGVCMVGTDKFTLAQWKSLAELVLKLLDIVDIRIGDETPIVVGHRDLPGVHKDCPGFDVQAWLVSAGLAGPLYEESPVG